MGLPRVAFVLLLLFAAGCAGGEEEDTGPDAGAADRALDSGVTDPDGGPDASTDSGLDAATDGGWDVGLDLGVDAGPDADVDAGPDANVDAGPDADVDAGPDADVDAGPDADVDAGPDAEVDGGPDADVDAGPDAAVDAGDSGPVGDLGVADAGPDAGPTDSGPPTIDLDWSWSRHSTGPTRMFGHRTIGYDRQLFVLGGRAPQCLSTNLSYDPYDDLYSTAPGEHFMQRGVLAWDGRLLLGGGGLTCDLNADPFLPLFVWEPATDRYDEVTDTFAAIAAAPIPGGFLALAEVPNLPFPAGLSWRVLDGATRTWSLANNGITANLAASVILVPLGGRVLYFGGSATVGIYDPGSDTWTPVGAPPVPLGASVRAVSIGDQIFFWDGLLGAIYDGIADAWTPVSTTLAPSGTSPSPVWTGSEVVVLDDQDGGHYDPVTDTWRPIHGVGRFWPTAGSTQQRDVVWTGEEIVVYGGQNGSGRYGPRPLPNPACAVPVPGLGLAITQPWVTRARNLGEVQPVEVDVTSALSVQRIDWSLDGLPVLSGPSGSIDLTGLDYGPHQLLVEVEDAMGNVTCDDRILYVDRAPILQVVAPVAYALSGTQLHLQATCVEDGGPCPIRAQIGPLTVNAVDTLDLMLDVSALDHSLQVVTFQATDARGLVTQRSVPVHLESTPATADTYFLGGPICHVRGRRALFVRAAQFWERDLTTGVESPIVIASANPPECSTARLVDGGAVLDFNPGSALFHYENGAVALQWTGSGLQVQSPWVLSRSGQLQLRELGPNTVTDLSATSLAAQLFLSTSGVVLYGNAAGELHRYLPGGSDLLLTTLSGAPANLYLRGTATQAIWREGSGNSWTIRRHDGAQVATVAGPSDAWGSSGPGPSDLAAAGDYVAYTRPDALGVLQVWLRGAGAAQLVTGFGDATRIAGVDEEGDVAYRRGDRTFHWQRATGIHTDVASDQAVVYTEGTVLWLVDGERIQRLP